MKGVDTMPSSINFNGVRTFRPGVYAVIDASALGGSGVSTGNVAVLGYFPLLPINTPVSFSTAKAMSDYFLGDADMQLLSKIAFSPSTDDRVGGGAAKLFVVNAGASSQATRTFLDSANTPSLLATSKLYGPVGNKIVMSCADNVNNTSLDIRVSLNGQQETFLAVESGVVFTTQFTGTGTAKMSGGISGVLLKEEFTGTAVAGADVSTNTVFSLPSAKQIMMKPSADPGATGLSVTVVGTLANGDAQTEVVSIPDINAIATTNSFASVATCTIASTGGAGAGIVVTFTATLANLAAADFNTVGEMVDTLDGMDRVFATRIAANIGTIPAAELDAFSFDTLAVAVSVRADLHAVINALASSALITATRAAGATTKPAAIVGGRLFDGGVATTPSAYTAAFDTLLTEDVQTVVPMDATLAAHKAALQHCKDAQLYGRERNAYVGAPSKTSLTDLFNNFTRALNSRHVALVGQSIKYSMPDGTTKTLAPMYFALMCACMQAGTSVATPLTRKRPDILGAEQHSGWNFITSANDAIQKGILALSMDNLGLRVERSVTTYMLDDNPIYSEVSANESINTSVRTLRARLAGQIGNPALKGTRAKIESTVKVTLLKQVKDGVIKGFRNVVVSDLGDRFDIAYEVAAIEPLNFIKITANVVRIAS